jgi:hypothetical protein
LRELLLHGGNTVLRAEGEEDEASNVGKLTSFGPGCSFSSGRS